MKVEVCHAVTGGATRIVVELEAGGTVRAAIDASAIVGRLSLDLETLAFAVFGRRANFDTVLEDGDRVELLRPLKVDPKEARRRRAAKRAATDASSR